jgi:50S ribosomal protein L16 3-hydroxylase
MNKTLLGGLSPRQFLARHWQKKPLFIPGAFPHFQDLLSPGQLMELAMQEDIQSRLVIERDGRWTVRHGPLRKQDMRGLKGQRWSLLVQGLDQILPEGKALLQRFSFIPQARLDDLMVSFAPNGGGVGPHFDSYDVFLLQGRGHKRWQVSSQRDRRLVPDAPLRILQHFRAEEEWTVGAGDLLYLPPKYAHYGMALDDCLTYSIGFRAPSARELIGQFLLFLEENLEVEGMYEDPDLALQRHPAEIGARMVDKTLDMLAQIKWNRSDAANFLGSYLTEPKPHVYFDPPQRPLPPRRFADQAVRRGVRLSLKTQMLFHGSNVFINGERLRAGGADRSALVRLADERRLERIDPQAGELIDLLYDWYCAGYLELAPARGSGRHA